MNLELLDCWLYRRCRFIDWKTNYGFVLLLISGCVSLQTWLSPLTPGASCSLPWSLFLLVVSPCWWIWADWSCGSAHPVKPAQCCSDTMPCGLQWAAEHGEIIRGERAGSQETEEEEVRCVMSLSLFMLSSSKHSITQISAKTKTNNNNNKNKQLMVPFIHS